MILGIGNDMVDIRRIERALARFGNRFLKRVFSEEEIAKATQKDAAPKAIASALAKRFAAKEACAKALGIGFAKGMYLRDIRIGNLPSGAPAITLHEGAQAALRNLQGERTTRIDLSMTDEYPYAQAFVIISAIHA